jgi:hypothetical protein
MYRTSTRFRFSCSYSSRDARGMLAPDEVGLGRYDGKSQGPSPAQPDARGVDPGDVLAQPSLIVDRRRRSGDRQASQLYESLTLASC